MMAPSPNPSDAVEETSLEPTPSQRVAVQVFPDYTRRVSKAWLRGVAEEALDSHDGGRPLCISLVIADDETVHRLNREYRGLDETTDVLSFPLWESKEKDDGFLLPDEEAMPMGEIVISYPQAARQARAGKKPVKSEMALLIVHGVLHLLGYDHADADEERAMWARQDEILEKIAAK